MDILSVVSVGLGIAGLGYALYQSHERRKLQDYNRSEAWYLYAKTNNMTGISQVAFERYKEIHADTLNPELIELMAKSSAFGLDLFRETVRLIQLSETDFDYASIDRWAQHGKIDGESHKSLFTGLVVDTKDTESVFQRMWRRAVDWRERRQTKSKNR
ncbi:hypothetical protein [Thiorhodococcus drewsii]|uniref:hypothetical protein n=1 Tax=Thiorhodococcus drewsii TaxID=210408 RepID=UPI001111FA9D|nr:hypothetical protein [Thiorhodococcus drewsii]